MPPIRAGGTLRGEALPQAVVQGPDGLFYVAEGAWRPGHVSPVHGKVTPASSRVSVLAEDGTVMERLGETGDGAGPAGTDLFYAAHGIMIDSVGGLMAKHLGKVPIPGSTVEVAGLLFRAEETEGRRNRIGTVLITPVVPTPESVEAPPLKA